MQELAERQACLLLNTCGHAFETHTQTIGDVFARSNLGGIRLNERDDGILGHGLLLSGQDIL